MMGLLFLSLAVSASLVGSSNARNVTSKLQVHVPKDLSKEGGYNHLESTFGVPSVGTFLELNVYYAESVLCSPRVNTRGGFPVRPPDGTSGKMMPWQPPYILMVDRGGCPHVTKVRNAQHAGAAGVIIADTKCQCRVRDTCQVHSGWPCESHLPAMTDGGSGGDITIPSFLMFKEDADPIRHYIKQNNVVRIEMSWPLPSPEDRVKYEFWTTPTESIRHEILHRFKETAAALGDYARFTPRVYLASGFGIGCNRGYEPQVCNAHCSPNMRYCSFPTGSIHEGSGRDDVRESLRRLCAWKLYGREDGVGVEWWDYFQEFTDRCVSTGSVGDEDCAKDAMNRAKMDYVRVQNCMRDSGGLEGDVKNSIFEEQLDALESAGVVMVPTVFVNGVDLRGAVELGTVFKAVCDGIATENVPKVCEICATCGDPMACVAQGHPACFASLDVVATGERVSFAVRSLFVVVGAALVGVLGAKYYQRRRSDEMRDHVRGILAEYMPLEGESGDVGSPMELANQSGGVVSTVSEEN